MDELDSRNIFTVSWQPLPEDITEFEIRGMSMNNTWEESEYIYEDNHYKAIDLFLDRKEINVISVDELYTDSADIFTRAEVEFYNRKSKIQLYIIQSWFGKQVWEKDFSSINHLILPEIDSKLKKSSNKITRNYTYFHKLSNIAIENANNFNTLRLAWYAACEVSDIKGTYNVVSSVIHELKTNTYNLFFLLEELYNREEKGYQWVADQLRPAFRSMKYTIHRLEKYENTVDVDNLEGYGFNENNLVRESVNSLNSVQNDLFKMFKPLATKEDSRNTRWSIVNSIIDADISKLGHDHI